MEKGKAVEVDEVKLAEMLNSIPDASNKKRIFTSTEDAFILAVYEQNKNKGVAAKKLGTSPDTMRRRYIELTEK
jgi:transcriptional regulator with PAS, ATPase and Fis domain